MNSSTKRLRWLILALVAAAVILLRLCRGELLQGKNPLLLLIWILALYMIYLLARRK